MRPKTLDLLLVLGIAVAAAPAAALDILAIDAGFVTEMGGSAKGDATVAPGAKYNYSVGRELHYGAGFLFSPLTPMDRKNYFVFDFAGLTDPIASASLTLWTGTYESVDPTELYGLKEITDPAAALGLTTALAGHVGPTDFDGPGDPGVMEADLLYDKLGDGPLILTDAFFVTAGMDDSFITITFNAGGVAYLNTFLGGSFVLGGLVPTAIPPASPQQPFGFTGPDIPDGDPLTPYLTIETVPVPEPGTGVLLGLGLLAIGSRRRR